MAEEEKENGNGEVGWNKKTTLWISILYDHCHDYYSMDIHMLAITVGWANDIGVS